MTESRLPTTGTKPQGVAAQIRAKAATQISTQKNRLTETLSSTVAADVRDMVRDLQEFGRRQPALLLAGSFAVGVVAARFLKSSARSVESSEFNSPLQFAEGDEPWSRG